MAAPEGNSFWQARRSHGRELAFPTPDDLWIACCGYFLWVEENPLKETRVFSTKDGPVTIELSKMRAMTIVGLCVFLDISRRTYGDYRRREKFSLVTDRVDAIIRTQKFEGAAANLLNPNIIARDLGLASRSAQTALRSTLR